MLRQVLKQLQVNDGSSMATDGRTGRRFNIHIHTVENGVVCVPMNHDTPRHSRPTDPGARQKVSPIERASPAALEE